MCAFVAAFLGCKQKKFKTKKNESSATKRQARFSFCRNALVSRGKRRAANCFGETQRLVSFGLVARPRIGLSFSVPLCAANEGDFSLFLQLREQIGERKSSVSVSAAAAAALFFRIVFHQWKIDICTHSWCVCVSRWLSRTTKRSRWWDRKFAHTQMHKCPTLCLTREKKRAVFDLVSLLCACLLTS